MAAAADYASRLKEKITGMTECAICKDTLSEARLLPCFHSFCLKCLKDYGAGRSPGDELKCPCCRKMFKIPPGGLDDLQVNHFVNKLIDVSALPENSQPDGEPRERNCDSCLPVYGERPAAGYCLECADYLCAHCIQKHKLAKASSNFKQHRTFPLDQIPDVNNLLKMTVNHCQYHPHHQIDFYCNVCKTTACLVCYMAKHKEHSCSDIKDASDTLKKKTDEDVETFRRFMIKTEDVLKRIDATGQNFKNQVETIEGNVRKRYEELQGLLEAQYQKLNQELDDLKSKRHKELGMMKEEAEHELLMLRSFERYWGEVKERGSTCDVVQAASSLQQRVDELMELHEERHLEKEDKSRAEYYQVEFTVAESFTITGAVVSGDLNPVGAIKENIQSNSNLYANWKQLLKTANAANILPGEVVINDMTISGTELFLIRQGQSCVLAHDLQNLVAVSRQLDIPNLTSASGIVYSPTDICLYVCNQTNPSYIHKLNLTNGALSGWDITKGQPYSLSLSRGQNLLVGFYDIGFIEEYNLGGELVRGVQLDGGITGIYRAIELNAGHFMICQWNPESRISMVDAEGRIMKVSGQGQLNHPMCLELDALDYLLVADMNNEKLRVFNMGLQHIGDLNTTDAQAVVNVKSFCWDKVNRRLIVGSGTGNIWTISPV